MTTTNTEYDIYMQSLRDAYEASRREDKKLRDYLLGVYGEPNVEPDTNPCASDDIIDAISYSSYSMPGCTRVSDVKSHNIDIRDDIADLYANAIDAGWTLDMIAAELLKHAEK